MDILYCLADAAQPLALHEISRQTGLNKATASRLLRSLANREMVSLSQNSGHYGLGLGVLRLSHGVIGAADIRQAARAPMERLAAFTEETVGLGILANDCHVYIDQVQSPRELRCVFPIGLPVPLYAGAGPRAILAYLPQDVQQRIIARTEFTQLTETTATNPEDLEQRLAHVRTTGVAVGLGERVAGIATMAAPVLDHRGYPVGELTVMAPRERFGPEERTGWSEPLRRAAEAVSAQLGYPHFATVRATPEASAAAGVL